ncbi:MAG: magnesium transporter CorA family protein [Sandaracinaceae bacterium]|nr:magnesium transporter CorA family protein [Sandaracinaceae bacterium]
MTQPQTRVYTHGVLTTQNCAISDISEHLAKEGTILWVDLYGPTAQELHALADELGLHELAVEDALGEHQRPKVDHYATHLFFACKAVSMDIGATKLVEHEIDAFIGDRWLITVRKHEDLSMAPVVARWDRSPDLAKHGVSFLLYGLLDVVVDGYFDAVEVFDTYYDDVSEGIFADTPLDPSKQKHWFEMRQALVRFHRIALPMREAISGLMRREHTAVAEPMYPYFQDVYDHVLRVTEATDSLRDLVSTIVETNLSLRDYRQNLIMKKVTSWAAIVAVPTLITGYYGMNIPFPGFGEQSAVITSGILLVTCSVGLYIAFKRKGWL